MKKPKLIHLLGTLFIVAAISVGFYYNLGDNPTKTTPDATSHGEQYLAPNDNITAGTWAVVAPIATPSVMGAGVSYMRNDTGWVYYIGGDQDFTGTAIARNASYNVNTNTWTVNAPLPTTIEIAGIARLKDSIYIVGGQVTSFFSTQSTVVYKYDVKANTYVIRAPLPVAVSGNKSVGYLDSLIFDVGGMTAGGSTATTAVYLYNTNTNTWRAATSLPTAECMGAFTVYGDTLFYIGGGAAYAGPYTSTVYKGTFSSSNHATITWTSVAAYSGANRWRFDANPWGTKGIIVAAGTGVEFGCSNECYVLKGNVWTAQPTMTTAVSNSGVGSVVYSSGIGKLVVASGTIYPGGPPYTTTTTQVYTDTVGGPSGGIWTEQVSNTTQGLNCVSTVDANVGWIGGNGGVVLRTTNAGTTWTNVTSGPIGTNAVYAICGIDANTCLASTSPGATFVYKTTNGGTLWTQVFTQPTPAFIDDIKMFGSSTTNGFMYGDPFGGRWELYKTTDGGSTWDSTGLYLPQVGAEAGWNNAMCIRGNTIWFGTNNTYVYRSTNGGVTGSWQTGATTGDANQFSVTFNGTTGMCGEASAFLSTNSGTNWTTATVPGTGTIFGCSNAFAEFWYDRGTNIYYSSNNGTSFASQYISPTASTYQGMSFVVYYGIVRGWSITNNGHISMFNELLTGVNNHNINNVPSNFELSQNYPNPFNPTTVIEYQVPKSTNVSLVVYDLLGREVQTLINDFKQAGSYKIEFNASNLSSGVYFYRLQTGDFVSTKKMMLIK